MAERNKTLLELENEWIEKLSSDKLSNDEKFDILSEVLDAQSSYGISCELRNFLKTTNIVRDIVNEYNENSMNRKIIPNIPKHRLSIPKDEVPTTNKSDISIEYNGTIYNYDSIYHIITGLYFGWKFNENTVIFNLQKIDEKTVNDYEKKFFNENNNKYKIGSYMFSFHFITEDEEESEGVDLYTGDVEEAIRYHNNNR